MRKILVLTISVMSLMTVIACQNKPVIEDQDTLGMESSLNSESELAATPEPEMTSTDVAMNDTTTDESATIPEPEATQPSTYESLGASSSGLGR